MASEADHKRMTSILVKDHPPSVNLKMPNNIPPNNSRNIFPFVMTRRPANPSVVSLKNHDGAGEFEYFWQKV